MFRAVPTDSGCYVDIVWLIDHRLTCAWDNSESEHRNVPLSPRMTIEAPESNFCSHIIRFETFYEWERIAVIEASHLLDSSEESVATKRFRISSQPL